MKLHELEIKISVSCEAEFKKIHAHCVNLLGPPASHLFISDCYYDTADDELKNKDFVVRIRSENDKTLITMKSPKALLSGGVRSRLELEFVAEDGKIVEKQLFEQGLQPSLIIEKKRITFIDKECEIVLDHLPFIGYFVEIEGPSEKAIQEMQQRLNLSSAPVYTQGYGTLIEKKFQELNLSTALIQATFVHEKKLLDRINT